MLYVTSTFRRTAMEVRDGNGIALSLVYSCHALCSRYLVVVPAAGIRRGPTAHSGRAKPAADRSLHHPAHYAGLVVSTFEHRTPAGRHSRCKWRYHISAQPRPQDAASPDVRVQRQLLHDG